MRITGRFFVCLVLPVIGSLILAYGAAIHAVYAVAIREGNVARAMAANPSSAMSLGLQAVEELKSQQYSQALATARSSLQRSPYDLRALRVIANAHRPADVDYTRRIFQQVTTLSLRDDTATAWLMQDALRSNMSYLEAYYADLLLRRRVVDPAFLFLQLDQLLSSEEGRSALAERLAARPPWREPFLGFSGLSADPGAVTALLVELRRMGAPASDAEASPVLRRLARSDHPAAARLAWFSLNPQAAESGSFVYDPELSGLPGPPPLNWESLPAPGGQVEWQAGGGSRGRVMLSLDPFTPRGALLRQLVFLPVGRYELIVRASAGSSTADGAFHAELVCDEGQSLAQFPIAATAASTQVSVGSVLVPAERCASQWLRITPVPRDSHQEVVLFLDAVLLRAVSGQAPR